MRYLFTFTGGTGHFLPTVPLATALRKRGHEIRYACQVGMINTVTHAGFPAVDAGGSTLLDPGVRRELRPVDRAAEQRVVRDVFAGRVALERAGRLREIAQRWSPDVVVRDEMDFGAAVAAESVGLAHAAVTVICAGGFATPDVVASALDRVRAELALAPDPEGAMAHRYLTLTPVPASFRDPADPLPPTAHHIRPAVSAAAAPARRSGDRSARRSVFVTLGTIFAQESGDLFPRLLSALQSLQVEALVTVGASLDPAELGPQPRAIRVERFVPLDSALRGRDAVISHAGSGTVLGALAYGLPSVLLPMGADQPWNADRARDLGVARVLEPVTATDTDIAAAVCEVLDRPGYRTAAHRVSAEIAELPSADHGADLLERLGKQQAPIPRDAA